MIDIKANYEKIVAIIHRGVGNTEIPIFTHCYDYLCAFGKCSLLTKLINCPWIEPEIASNKLHGKIDDIMKEIFNKFYKSTNSVNGLYSVKTIGTLEKDPNLWSDEIHPDTYATNQLAKAYVAGIIQQKPDLLT